MKNDPLEGCEAASAECIKSLFKAFACARYICKYLTPSLLTQHKWTQHGSTNSLWVSRNKKVKYQVVDVVNPNERKFLSYCFSVMLQFTAGFQAVATFNGIY